MPGGLTRNLVLALVLFALGCAALAAVGGTDFHSLHTILDTCVFLVGSVLALLLWDIGLRTQQALPRLLATCFAVVSVLELIHAATVLELPWLSEEMRREAANWRPGTWAPSAHVLLAGLAGALLLRKRPAIRNWLFALALLALGLALIPLFEWLPRYSSPGMLGVTRPTLLLIPILWVPIVIAYWKLKSQERIAAAVAMLGFIVFFGHLAMLYSQSPGDAPAMAAHLGKLISRLFLLLSLMQMATSDMAQRIRAERELMQLNESLEARVHERTTVLESTNAVLLYEIETRKIAEKKTQMHLQRLNLLQQITQAIAERQDLNSVYQVVIRRLEDQLPIDFGCICTYDPVAKSLTVCNVGVRSGPLAIALALPLRAQIEIDENGLSRCVHGELVYESDLADIPFPFPQRLARAGLGSVVVAPLAVKNSVFGVLIAARIANKSFSSGDCEFLQQLSAHVALAAHQTKLFGALQRSYDELRQTQQAVLEQERLRALGQMASGIAHDINNAISPISIYTETLLAKEPGISAHGREQLMTIARAIDDVAETVARLQEFYRHREGQAVLIPVDLAELVAQVIELTRARWQDMPQRRGIVISVNSECGSAIPHVPGIESELREALTNLIFNSVDAMPEGGVITLRTGMLDAGTPYQRVHLDVTDNGIGMDDVTRQRCLEPFFTTKGERGTGLGLPMVYGIVQRHGAEIEIQSTPGAGTTMRLIFAPSMPAVAVAASVVAAEPLEPRARLRILLVDDDPIVLQSMSAGLEMDGHTVSTASGGMEGIERFEEARATSEPFDIVITDLGMPYVDGSQVARAVKGASAATPVLMLTGWGHRLVSDAGIPAHVDRMLSKPPKLVEIRAALAQLCRS